MKKEAARRPTRAVRVQEAVRGSVLPDEAAWDPRPGGNHQAAALHRALLPGETQYGAWRSGCCPG